MIPKIIVKHLSQAIPLFDENLIGFFKSQTGIGETINFTLKENGNNDNIALLKLAQDSRTTILVATPQHWSNSAVGYQLWERYKVKKVKRFNLGGYYGQYFTLEKEKLNQAWLNSMSEIFPGYIFDISKFHNLDFSTLRSKLKNGLYSYREIVTPKLIIFELLDELNKAYPKRNWKSFYSCKKDSNNSTNIEVGFGIQEYSVKLPAFSVKYKDASMKIDLCIEPSGKSYEARGCFELQGYLYDLLHHEGLVNLLTVATS